MKKTIRYLALAFGGVALVVLVTAVFLYVEDYSDYFTARRGGPIRDVGIEAIGKDSLFEKSLLTIVTQEGFTVVCGMLVPPQTSSHDRFPAIILLGGKATGKYAVDYVLDVSNTIIVAPDYPYEPRESYTLTGFLSDVPDIRQAIIDMVPSVMVILDYLMTRPDVDTTRIVMLGYSFGAPFVPAILAHDRRPAAAAMVYGGGELRTLIRHNVRRYRGPLMSEFVGSLSGLLLRPVEPLRYVDQIAPIPLIMLNGTEDEQIPRENTMMLFERAKEPKKLLWLDSRHVNPRNVELTRKIIATLKQELIEMDILFEDS